jgi:phycocyanobilin:ferredoxin oxidoreductase
MLGADLVGLGKDAGVLVADLSPVPQGRTPALASEPALREPELNQLRALGLPPGGTLPAWCQPWFSAQPVFSRVAPQHAPAVAAALGVLCERFVQLAAQCEAQPGSAPAVAEWQARYCEAHRRDDRGLGLLHKLFDPALAERFLRQILFPEGERA